ncbi:MAG: hypothetical protein MZV70_67955 [Desulfobacterales bacterium]|nr:hypothetical protein [Desulfobacterales bacterium]
MDHIQFLVVAKAAGVKDLKQHPVHRLPGQRRPPQLLGGHIDLLSTGLGDVRGLVESGRPRGARHHRDRPKGPDSASATTYPTVQGAGRQRRVPQLARHLRAARACPTYAGRPSGGDALAKMVQDPRMEEEPARANGWSHRTTPTSPDFARLLDGGQDTALRGTSVSESSRDGQGSKRLTGARPCRRGGYAPGPARTPASCGGVL